MSILGAVIVPHPPLIIPTVGRGREQEVQATINSYRTVAEQVAVWEPEVLIITSPHQVMYADYFHISPGRGATGDMSAFGAAQTKLVVEYDAPLRDEIIRCGEAAGLRVGTLGQRDPYLDHGTFVPLDFLREAGVDCPILRIGLSGFSPIDHYRLHDFLFVELGKAILRGNSPRQCRLCEKWFLHEQGDKAIYCECIAPNEENKTCREAGARAVFEKKIQDEETWKIYKRAYKKYYARYMKGNMSEADFKAWAAKAIADRDAAIEQIKPLYDEMMRAKVIEHLREKLNRQ